MGLDRPSRWSSGVFIFAVVSTAALLASPSVRSQGPAATVFVSPDGSDAGACTNSSPCATFGRAYRLASPGTVIEVMGGGYGRQVITRAAKTVGAPIVYRPTLGATVRVAGLIVEADGVEFRDLQTRWTVRGATGVTLRNVRADGPVYIHGASNVSVLGGEVYSPTPVKTDSQISSINGRVPTNIVLDRVAFHDWVDAGPGQRHHIECLQVGSGIDLTIRNSTFRNCDTHDIFVRSWGRANKNPHPLQRVVFENNWFARTNAGYASVQVRDDLWKDSPTSFVLRNNTALQSFSVDLQNGTAAVTETSCRR